jgi:cytochrome P450
MSAIRRSCCETLRLTSHSIGALRKVSEEVVLGSGTSQQYKLCPGQVVAVSHIVPSLDEQLWGKDADKYNPSREEWTTEGKQPDEYKFSTFSQGHHRCPGQSIALQIMELTLSILMVDYEVTLRQKKESVPDVCFERATLAQRKGKVPVLIQIR